MKNKSLLLAALIALASVALDASAASYIMRVPSKGLQATPPSNGIALANGAHTWADGSLAASCDVYRQGDGTHVYSGATGDGIYAINLQGVSTDVYCDMTTDGGGWTRVVGINAGNINHVNSSAVAWTNNDPSSDGKLSDAQINALKSSTSNTTPTLRLTCGTATVYFPGSCTFNAGSTSSGAAGDCLKYATSYSTPQWNTGWSSNQCGSTSYYGTLSSLQLSTACGSEASTSGHLAYAYLDWRGAAYDAGCDNTTGSGGAGAVYVK